MTAPRVRFAPSPTGYLHVGGARTALFNWLLARKTGGTFALRIEDTDRARSTEEHTEAILQGMRWLGLDWDEGPWFQGEGVERHRSDAHRLLRDGKAYRDFSDPESLRREAAERGMSPDRLARARADALDEGEAERRAEAGEAHAVRYRVPEGETAWDDLVHGRVRFAHEDLDDLVILRSDGTPTYNLAVVSDDAHAEITHVIRGDDHLSNTPKQILLYEALGKPVPEFGHVPLILGPDGKRLSKRHGATAVAAYEDEGILPEAMVNFLALLGWSPGDDREVFTVPELIDAFSVDRILKKSSVFDVEKLEWLNGRHLARRPAEELVPLVWAALERRGGAESSGSAHPSGESDPSDVRLEALVDLLKVRARTVEDMAFQAVPFLVQEPELDPAATAKHWEKDPVAVRERMERLRDRLATAEWAEGPLEDELRSLAGELDVGAGKLIHPLRVALTGRTASPGIFEVLVVLGREASLGRLNRAIDVLEARP